MRYRPFGGTGISTSAISVALTDTPQKRRAEDWRDLVYCGLENGVNAFEIIGLNPAIIDGTALGLQALDRHMMFVGLRLGLMADGRRNFDASRMTHQIEAVLARTGWSHLDMVQLDDPGQQELAHEALDALKALRANGKVSQIGVAGTGPAMDAYLATGAFDVLTLPWNLSSGWTERHRLKAAQDQNMAVIGQDYFPAKFHPHQERSVRKKPPFWSFKRPAPIRDTSAYSFLHETRGWTAEEICLSYTLTEPSIATVQIPTDSISRLAELADVTERDMPPGLATRIEMARIGQVKMAS